jgi:hypothetical protein
MALRSMVELRNSGFHRLVMEWNKKYFSGQERGINGVDFPTFNTMVSEAIEEERRLKGEEEQQIQKQGTRTWRIYTGSRRPVPRSPSDENSNRSTPSTKRQKRSHHNADDRVLSSSSPDSDLYFRTF